MSDEDDSSRSGDDAGGVQPHSVLKIKNVLYYKKHSRTAIPTKGTLRLCDKKLSFQSKGLDFSWRMSSICVEPFKGRVNSGLKIVGTCLEGEIAEEEFIFTKIKPSSYEAICSAVDDAKFNAEMKRVRRSSIDSITSSGMSLSESLSVDDERILRADERPSMLRSIYRCIFWIIYKIASFIYKLFTGRRLWGPKNLHEALHCVLAKIGPIKAVAKQTLPKQRVALIQNNIDCIHESLLKMQRIVRRQQSTYLSRGLVVESVTKSSLIQQRRGEIASFISFLIFSLRKTLNVPVLFRWDVLQLYQYPTTVSQAVQNANERLEALMELAVDEKYASGKETREKILEEAKSIQMALFNIKLIAVTESSPATLRSKED